MIESNNKESVTSKFTVGVDLGTTNTCAAIAKDGIATFLELEPSSITMPSAVRFTDGKSDNIIIGRLAKKSAIMKPKEVFTSFKTLMQNDEWLSDPKIVEQYNIDGVQMTPTDMATIILKHVFKVANESEFAKENPIDSVLICVPAASTPYYHNEVIKAAMAAGFGMKDAMGNIMLDENSRPMGINVLAEPFAAAYSYGMKNGFFEPDKSKDQNIMVYDLGGGTFDVSILNVVSEKDKMPKFKLLGTYGNAHLGGDNIDTALMKIAAKQFYKETQIDLLNASKENKGCKIKEVLLAQSTLKELAERAKIEDFAQGATESTLEQPAIIHDNEEDEDRDLNIVITREQFLADIKPLLDKTIDCMKKALDESKLNLEDINRFVLVGGSSKGPWVKEIVNEFIEKETYLADNVDVIVGEGASIYANKNEYDIKEPDGSNDKKNEIKPDTPKLTNKTTHNYGVEVRGGSFVPLVPKGMPFDEEHESYTGTLKCTNPNSSGQLFITGWTSMDEVVNRDTDGNFIINKEGNYTSDYSVHYINPDGSKMFESMGVFSLNVPMAAPHTLDVTLMLTVLKDNTIKIEMKVGDGKPFIQKWK